jgi:tRNA dimethylallyltransferase
VPNNYYRMLRVLEIVVATGRPRSKLNLDTKAPLDYDIRCFYLDRPRISLYRRIDLRCEQMLQGGMLQVHNAHVSRDGCPAPCS